MRFDEYIRAYDVGTDTFRLFLTRLWDADKPTLGVIMLNPSYGNGHADDPTITKLVTIANAHGFGGISIVNLFDVKTPDFKRDIRSQKISSGITSAQNDKYIDDVLSEYDEILLAWGHDGAYLNRDREVLNRLPSDKKYLCLGVNKNGTPKHPGHLANNTSLEEFPNV